MTDDPNIPKCDKCGAEIDTGLMVCGCPHRERCEFWCDDWSEDIKAGIRRSWESGEFIDALGPPSEVAQ